MRLSTVVVAAAAVGLSTVLPSAEEADGFHIHPSLPDGHYSIQLHEDGNHHVRRWSDERQDWQRLVKRKTSGEWTFLVDDGTNKVEAVSHDIYAEQRLPLPKSQTSCVHPRDYNTLNYPLIPEDYYQSKLAFFNWCKLFQFKAGHVSMALSGSTAVYVCQREVTQLGRNRCAEGEFKVAEAQLNASCGDAGGFVYIFDWNKEYGRMWRGERVCRKWNALRYLPKLNDFHQTKGWGAFTDEPKGDWPEKTKEQHYHDAVWEPLVPVDKENEG